MSFQFRMCTHSAVPLGDLSSYMGKKQEIAGAAEWRHQQVTCAQSMEPAAASVNGWSNRRQRSMRWGKGCPYTLSRCPLQPLVLMRVK